MTAAASETTCVLCSQPATESIDPPRRTMARGVDPDDESFSVTVILPDVQLCAEHALAIAQKELLIGWCDDERCRTYGEIDKPSACGEPYTKMGSSGRS